MNAKSLPTGVTDYFTEVVRSTIEYRERENVNRNDILQTLIDLRKNEETELSIEEIASNSYVFFFASVEEIASSVSFTLYELSRNLNCLRKAQDEIQVVLSKYGEFSYDSLNEIKFIDLCMKGNNISSCSMSKFNPFRISPPLHSITHHKQAISDGLHHSRA